MQLCAFSKSEIHDDKILATCPLGLSSTAAKRCPARKRLYHVPPLDLRVLSCQFPDDWQGKRIVDPEGVRERLSPAKKRVGVKSATNERGKGDSTMTTETATAETTAIAARPTQATGISVYDRITDPMAFVERFGVTLFNSKMFGLNNADQGKALAWMFVVKRIDPFDFRRRHHVIGGTVSMSAEAMLADFRTKLGGSHDIISRTYDKAAIQLVLGKKKQIFEFTWEDAQREDYCYTTDANNGKMAKIVNGQLNPRALKDNWSTPRRRMQMLWARVVSDGVGAMAPEIAGGYLTPEELGLPTHGEVISDVVDAEFTVTQSHGAVDPGPAEVQTAPFVVEGEIEPGVATQIVEQAGDPATEPAPAKPTELPVDDPSEKLTAARDKLDATPTTKEVAAADMSCSVQVDEKTALLRRLGPLKRELLSDVQYQKVLNDNYKVPTAKDLTVEQLTKLVTNLEAEKAKLAAAATQAAPQGGTDDLSRWANQAIQKPGN